MVIISGLITPLRFLQTGRNKDNFFKLLTSAIHEFERPAQKQVISTHGPNGVSSPIADMSGLFCTQEEANMLLIHFIMVTIR